MSYRVLKLAGVALRAIHTTVFLMSDLRFDWHPSLSSPLIDERRALWWRKEEASILDARCCRYCADAPPMN